MIGYGVSMREAEWQNLICSLADLTGWRWFHPADNRPSANTGRVQRVRAGFPDLTLLRGQRLLFVEVKAEKGRASDAQLAWLDALGDLGAGVMFLGEQAIIDGPHPSIETYLWRPSDWPLVQQVLAHGGTRPVNAVDHRGRPAVGRPLGKE